ncbi:MAG: leucyl aminopeptidase [Nitrososphaerales archaeon]
MNVDVDSGRILEKNYELLVLGAFEDEEVRGTSEKIDKALSQEISKMLKTPEFEGKPKQISLIHTHGRIGIQRILLVGLGKRKEFNLEAVRMASGKAAQFTRDLGVTSYATTILGDVEKVPLNRIVENTVAGCELALYQFNRYKTEDKEAQRKIDNVTVFTEAPESVDEVRKSIFTAQVIDRGVILARDLSNTPSNDATPAYVAEEAKKVAHENDMKCTVLKTGDMEKLGMGGIINVARGSRQPPKLVILEYNGGREARPIVLIGKGITFDSGGISIKPSEKMEEMKHDKSGAASVIATMQTAAQLQLPLNIIGITPLTENLPSGSAYKPGDILKIYNGKTVEVISTDAEGRLIMADALAYVSKYKPQATIDLATLTGACIIALGGVATGLLGNDDDLKRRVTSAGETTGERVWELPLWDDYKEQLKSEVADMKNVGGKPAGAITAASFLSNFVDYPWVHLDIAGTAWTQNGSPEKPYIPKGATGVGVRLIIEVLRGWKS